MNQPQGAFTAWKTANAANQGFPPALGKPDLNTLTGAPLLPTLLFLVP